MLIYTIIIYKYKGKNKNGPSSAEEKGGSSSFLNMFKGKSNNNDIEKGGGGTQEEKTSLMGGIFGNTETPTTTEWCCNLTRTERLQGFTFLLIVSVIFFLVAFFIGLPMVLLSPGSLSLSLSYTISLSHTHTHTF